jgi:hypothetical protein
MYKDLASGRLLSADKTAVFANSAPVNTQNNIDISIDKSLISGPKTKCQIEVYNPSAVTDLTVKVMAIEPALGGGTRYCLIDTWTVPKSAAATGTTVSAHLKQYEGLFNGADLRLVVSNATILGVSDGFTASFRIKEL